NFPAVEKKDGFILSPGKFTNIEKEKLISIIKKLHEYLNSPQYLKSDFILNKSRNIYLNNIEFFPNTNEDSCFCKSCESVGTNSHSVIEHILETALFKKSF
ncbi:hypothetical protein COX94_00705, partial [Candidatus Nomurabacteria bacterium CG_4_10_14_0_2_um_filter_33_9]